MFKQFFKNSNGNVALIFSIMAVPLLMGVGVAIDSSRVTSAHKKLQDAADVAALGAALKYKAEGAKEMRKEGKALLESNHNSPEGLTVTKIKTKKTAANTVKIESEATLEPMFMQIFGYPKMGIAVTSEASLGSAIGMEIAIAFDATSSMKMDTRWNDAMSAMNLTLQDMKELTGKSEFYVSLVPFQDRVNIGKMNGSWLDNRPPGWNGCAEPREESSHGFEWSVDNDNPKIDTFTASIPGVTGGLSNPACPNVAIVGPTKNPNKIIQAAKKLDSGGTGRFDVGLAWAWRVLSPQWQGYWGVSNYPSGKAKPRKKKLIFISDGNTIAYQYEMSKEETWGWNQGSKVGFDHIVDLCRRIKTDGVEIYMLQIDGNPKSVPYFQNCASSPSHYYEVSDATGISVVFDDILTDLVSELRIVR